MLYSNTATSKPRTMKRQHEAALFHKQPSLDVFYTPQTEFTEPSSDLAAII